MSTRPSIHLASVARLEHKAGKRGALAVLPEVANTAEHAERRPDRRPCKMRRFDPGGNRKAWSPAAHFMRPTDQDQVDPDRAMCITQMRECHSQDSF